MRTFFLFVSILLLVGCKSNSKINSSNSVQQEFFERCKYSKNHTEAFRFAFTNLGINDTLYLEKDKTYFVNALQIALPVILEGKGSTIVALPQPKKNVGFSFSRNLFIENVVFDGVWIALKTENLSNAIIKNCSFKNQTYSAITASDSASGIQIVDNYFSGKSKGFNKNATYPCLQITTGARNVTFRRNTCENTEAGVTADGIKKLINQITVEENKFKNLTYYAMKMDVGNDFKFQKNSIENSKYGVFYEAYDEFKKYSQRSGNDALIKNNHFRNVDRCLYVAGKNPNSSLIFEDNKMNLCKIGVARSCGELVIRGNEFKYGESLYHFSGGLVEGNINIEKNKITNSSLNGNAKVDWEGEIIEGALVFSCGRMTDLGQIMVRNNEFKDWEGSAIKVARVANSYNTINVNNNTFENNNKKKAEIIVVVAASQVIIENNSLLGEVKSKFRQPSPKRVGNPKNSGKSSLIKVRNNSWQ